MKTDLVIAHITAWLKDHAGRSGQTGFVVGISGGVDSAVTSALCARTGLPTLCVEMPIHQSATQVRRAQDHITALTRAHPNVARELVELTSVFDELLKVLPQDPDSDTMDMARVNARARLRMTTLYYFAGLHRRLVAGTGNKVEDFGVGFFTKYGDGGVDLSPIADLTKTEVYHVAGALGIGQAIMDAPPTDGLWGDERTDEDQIGASYPELEWAMRLREDGTDTSRLQLSDREIQLLAIYDRRHAANRHKMEPIPVCRIPDALRGD